jgi:hypothetical protein
MNRALPISVASSNSAAIPLVTGMGLIVLAIINWRYLEPDASLEVMLVGKRLGRRVARIRRIGGTVVLALMATASVVVGVVRLVG